MNPPEFRGVSREKSIELLVQIASGLLASGHYTFQDEESNRHGFCWRLKSKSISAVEDAETILDSIVESHDRLIASMSDK